LGFAQIAQQAKQYFHCKTPKVDELNAASLSKSSTSVNDEAATEITPHHDPFHLTTSTIIKLRRSRLLPKLPSITIEQINDKNKSDAFTGAISVIQIAWISVQVVARAARRLVISQLEISVLVFSACAIIIYALNWKKPKAVSAPYTLLSFHGDIPSKVVRGAGGNNGAKVFVGSLLSSLFDYERQPETLGRRVSNHSSVEQEDPYYNSSFNIFGLFIGTSLVGGLHATAWNFSLPTKIEQIIWLVSSVTCIIYIFPILFCFTIFPSFDYKAELLYSAWVQVRRLTFRFISTVYVLARLFLIVEIVSHAFFSPARRLYVNLDDEYSSFSLKYRLCRPRHKDNIKLICILLPLGHKHG
jgi:hypothetical protein